MSADMTLPKYKIFTMRVYGEFLYVLSNSTEIFSEYIKNVDAYHVRFSFKKQTIKKLLPKSV